MLQTIVVLCNWFVVGQYGRRHVAPVWRCIAVRWSSIAVRWSSIAVRWSTVAARWSTIAVRWNIVAIRGSVAVHWWAIGSGRRIAVGVDNRLVIVVI